MKFWLGVHHSEWLERTDVPLFVSHRSLRRRVTLPRACGPWILDSGGFTELSANASYLRGAVDYAYDVQRYSDEIGGLRHAAIQDWMCEPAMLARTGLTIADHQRLTIESYLTLRELAPELPWLPVLQGQSVGDYLRHVDAYMSCGVDLWAQPLVGLGSVCRRQHTPEAAQLVLDLARLNLRLHGFGFKTTALERCGRAIASSDSMAWSLDGRLPHGSRCQGQHVGHCGNCLEHALSWRRRLLSRLAQEWLPEFEAAFA